MSPVIFHFVVCFIASFYSGSTAEARERMQKELGLNKNSNGENQSKGNEQNVNIDDIDDTDDVDALLANVDVDGASDISGTSGAWSMVE